MSYVSVGATRGQRPSARDEAKASAKEKSRAKQLECKARGGVYDPTAPGGCRVPGESGGGGGGGGGSGMMKYAVPIAGGAALLLLTVLLRGRKRSAA